MSLTGPELFPLGDAVAVFLYLPDAPAPVTIVGEVVRIAEVLPLAMAEVRTAGAAGR